MTRARWIAIAVVIVGLFAIVVGGFLWPRPQFRSGPWGDRPGADSIRGSASPPGIPD